MFLNRKLDFNNCKSLNYQSEKFINSIDFNTNVLFDKQILHSNFILLKTKTGNNFPKTSLKPKILDTFAKKDTKKEEKIIGIVRREVSNFKESDGDIMISKSTKKQIGRKNKNYKVNKKEHDVNISSKNSSSKNQVVVKGVKEVIGPKTKISDKNTKKDSFVSEVKKSNNIDNQKTNNKVKSNNTKHIESQSNLVAFNKNNSTKSKKIVDTTSKKDYKSNIFNKDNNVSSLESPAKESKLCSEFKNKDNKSKKDCKSTNTIDLIDRYNKVTAKNNQTSNFVSNKECANTLCFDYKLDNNFLQGDISEKTDKVNKKGLFDKYNQYKDNTKSKLSENVNKFNQVNKKDLSNVESISQCSSSNYDKYKNITSTSNVSVNDSVNNDKYSKYKNTTLASSISVDDSVVNDKYDKYKNIDLNINEVSTKYCNEAVDVKNTICKKEEIDEILGRTKKVDEDTFVNKIKDTNRSNAFEETSSDCNDYSNENVQTQSFDNLDKVEKHLSNVFDNSDVENVDIVDVNSSQVVSSIKEGSVIDISELLNKDDNIHLLNSNNINYTTTTKPIECGYEMINDIDEYNDLNKEVAMDVTNEHNYKKSSFISNLFNKKTSDIKLENTTENKVSLITHIKNKIEKAIEFINSMLKKNKNDKKIE